MQSNNFFNSIDLTVYDKKQKISRKPLSGVVSGGGGGKQSLSKCGGINNPTHYTR